MQLFAINIRCVVAQQSAVVAASSLMLFCHVWALRHAYSTNQFFMVSATEMHFFAPELNHCLMYPFYHKSKTVWVNDLFNVSIYFSRCQINVKNSAFVSFHIIVKGIPLKV